MSETPTTSPGSPNSPSHRYQLVEDRLLVRHGQRLDQFILSRRPEQNPMPYWRIAYDLVSLTDIDITHEAVRRWYHDLVKSGVTLVQVPGTPAQ